MPRFETLKHISTHVKFNHGYAVYVDTILENEFGQQYRLHSAANLYDLEPLTKEEAAEYERKTSS